MTRKTKVAWLAWIAVGTLSGCSCGTDATTTDGGVLSGDAPGLDDAAMDGAGMDAAGTDGGGADAAVDPCPGPAIDCGGTCVTPSVDPLHCGGCGVVCAATEVCVSNACVADCPAPLSECDRTCVDTDSDNAHCGACGMACGAGEGCVGGACVPSVPLDPPPARCVGGGPPIVIDDGTTTECADAVAAVSFTFGLCACEDIGVPALSSRTRVDAYDSAMGPYLAGGGRGGGVGANGSINLASDLEATGDVRTAAGSGLDVGGITTVGYQLHVATSLSLGARLDVGDDTFVGGAITGGSAATITGDLHVPACGSVPGNVSAAACIMEAVSVPDPCACGTDERVNVAGIVAHYAMPANNDNTTVGLDPAVFTTPGAPARLDLPCGYYYLDGISSGGALTIAAHGRTALVIGGSVEVGSPITFALDPGATLDVFVGGTLRASALLTVGSPAYPRQSRVYVGGVCGASGASCSSDGDCCSGACGGGTCDPGGSGPPWSVYLESNSQLAGLFYAAEGAFVSSSDLEMYGAIFAGTFHNTAATDIHYDRAAIGLGADCPTDDPGPTPDGGLPDGGGIDAGVPGCLSCRDCGNQACIDGACGDCRTSADCCAPLICSAGTCVLPPF